MKKTTEQDEKWLREKAAVEDTSIATAGNQPELSNELQVAVAQFWKRKQANKGKEKIDNGRLYAGSPMYYYCHGCDDLVATLPESHLSRPPSHCVPCKFLLELGLLPKA